jgi:hypothetical protein
MQGVFLQHNSVLPYFARQRLVAKVWQFVDVVATRAPED